MPSYAGLLGDPRLEQRADHIYAALTTYQTVTVRQFAPTGAEQMGAYRFFSNERVRHEALIEALLRDCGLRVKPRHYLIVQDTTQANYQHLARRLREPTSLGVIGDNKSLGFFLHPSLVIDADTGDCLGVSDVRLWTRPADRPLKKERKYKTLPLEEKESARWVESVEASRERLAGAEMLTSVSDREGDIFEAFARIPDARTHQLVRSQTDRRIAEPAGTLYAYLAAQPAAGSYRVELRGDLRKKRTGRQAEIEVRFGRVHLVRPKRLSGSGYPEQIAVYVVEAKERPESVPAGEKPIHWRLVTTHAVNDLVEARQVIVWYKLRWYVEQLFRLMKSDGFDVESSELETDGAVQKVCLMALGASLDVMRLLLARDGGSGQPLSHVFSATEQACLLALLSRLEGATQKQQNPHEPGSLAWGSWIIARLGGWKGYRSQAPPGPITFYRGLKRFGLTYEGWLLSR